MGIQTFGCRSRFPVPVKELFDWHGRPGAFNRLNAPFDRFEVLQPSQGITNGTRTVIRAPVFGPFRRRWVAEHFDYVEGRQFNDRQIEGPFVKFEQQHLFEPDGPAASILEDRIEYVLPLGVLGQLLGGRKVRRKLRRTFAYRHAVLGHDLALHAGRPDSEPWRILVSGASGLVGAALTAFLTTGGHEVVRLSRGTAYEGDLSWDAVAESGDLNVLEGFDAVIHLAGESIAKGRWSAAKKQRIRASRIETTRNLCEALAKLAVPPRVLVSASAVGYYGNRGDEVLDEESANGSDFLSGVCRDWEAAAAPARDKGIRVAHARFGVILSMAGGALAAMLTPFRMGAGGKIGNGRQYLSWIALDDVLGALYHVLYHDNISGPVNVVAPEPVTNYELTKTLGRVLRRPTVFPMPAFAARLAFGEMADALLLISQRVKPKKLLESGFAFSFGDLTTALQHILGKNEIGEAG
ncbi:MAG: TIGR01777 family protein [Planctomycetes bacterium]|nr:TIGR01777 family protein [Planctomycetota bacterium]